MLALSDGFCIFSSIREGWTGDHLLYASKYSAAGELLNTVELGTSGFKFDFPAAFMADKSGNILLETIVSVDYSTQSLSASLLTPEFAETWKNTIIPATSLSQVNVEHNSKAFTTYYVDAPSSDQVGIFGIRLDYTGAALPEDKTDCQLDIVLTKAGTLSSKVPADKIYTTKSMRVRGLINSDDVRFLRKMAGVEDIATETPGILSEIDLSGATIVPGGEPYMSYYDTDIWEDVSLTTTDFVVPPYLFSKCSVTKVLVPENSIEIGHHAFADCGKLLSLIIPEGVTAIGNDAFAGSGLTSPVVPESVTSIGSYAFWGCAYLETITLPENLTKIPADGMSAITSPAGHPDGITIADGVTTIGESCFELNLKSVKAALSSILI